MRYLTTLTLASMAAITAIAFVMEWHDIFAVVGAITVIFIGLPVLSLASNFWFGPLVHVHDQYDKDYDRLSWLDRRGRRG